MCKSDSGPFNNRLIRFNELIQLINHTMTSHTRSYIIKTANDVDVLQFTAYKVHKLVFISSAFT